MVIMLTYTFDAQPVAVLFWTIVITIIIGGIVGMAIGYYPDWFINMWLGGALAGFPAFLSGLLIQSKLTPGRLSQNKGVVYFLGSITLAVSSVAIFGLILGWFSA
jgi:hypothetical protein